MVVVNRDALLEVVTLCPINWCSRLVIPFQIAGVVTATHADRG
jgi:hypothetical protein